MMSHSICENIKDLKQEIENVDLVVVSKYRSLAELQAVYDCNHRDFGENRVQEMVDKQQHLPADIKWHAIGHLQTNKVKYIASFVHMIHSVDSLKLLRVINKEAEKHNRVISFLFQIHIAEETSKFGLTISGLKQILASDDYRNLNHVKCKGLMGMSTLTEDKDQVRSEFSSLRNLFIAHAEQESWSTLSMGMSGDYQDAIECGSNMIRVGSKVFS